MLFNEPKNFQACDPYLKSLPAACTQDCPEKKILDLSRILNIGRSFRARHPDTNETECCKLTEEI